MAKVRVPTSKTVHVQYEHVSDDSKRNRQSSKKHKRQKGNCVTRTTKFQADLAQTDFDALQALMEQMEVRSKADFLAKAIYFIRWAVAERMKGYRIVTVSPDGSQVKEVVMPELERVAPQLNSMPIQWTDEEIKNFKKLASEKQPEPTDRLVRAMRNR